MKQLNGIFSAMVVAAGFVLLTATLAAADEPAPVKPSPEDVAILRALLGIAPLHAAHPLPTAVSAAVRPANPVIAPAPQVEAAAPAQPASAAKPELQPCVPAPAKDDTALGTDNAKATSDNTFVVRSPYQIARAVMAAKAASQRVQLAQR